MIVEHLNPLSGEIWSRSDSVASVRSDTDVGLTVLDGVEVRALFRPVRFFQNKLGNPFLYGAGLVHEGIVMLKQKRDKVGRAVLSKIELYAVAIKFSFLLEIKDPNPTMKKNG